jgi:MYXO-CTERM domain-containing protein
MTWMQVDVAPPGGGCGCQVVGAPAGGALGVWLVLGLWAVRGRSRR